MESRRVADYFVVAGLPETNLQRLEEFSCDSGPLKESHSWHPVTDITVIDRTLCEEVPEGFTCLEKTPAGHSANLNGGTLRGHEMYLCYRRSRDKQPLTDIGILFDDVRERLLPDSQMVEFTQKEHTANINSSTSPAYVTYRRGKETDPFNELVVSDICIIVTSRGEKTPHTFNRVDRNLNKNTVVGSDIFLCYKKTTNRCDYLAYKPAILDSFPSCPPRPDVPLPPDLALFCLPTGATLEAWPAASVRPDPVSSAFVLTVTTTEGNTEEAVEKLYCSAVYFYDEHPIEKLTPEQRDALHLDALNTRTRRVYTNRCIAVLSRWPFFDTFEKFLRFLLKMINSCEPHHVPIERYIFHLLESVPFPTARRPRILVQLSPHDRISLAQPEESPINLSGAKFRVLVRTLLPEGCLQVLLFALTEQKVLLHSLRPDVLTSVAEAISMMIFPLRWQCPYIPVCPLTLADLLNAPIPFLLGLDSSYFNMYDPPSDVICIDLDTGAIDVPDDRSFLTYKLLPRKPARHLLRSLAALSGKIFAFEALLAAHEGRDSVDISIDAEFKIRQKEQELDMEIQETFLRFLANVLKGYSHFLLPIVSGISAPVEGSYDTSRLFDIDAFIKSRDRAFTKFYNMLVNTQMFSKFVEERSFVTEKDASFAFFDECVEKVREDGACGRLLELEAAHSEHTFFMPPPEPPPFLVQGETFSYTAFPKLQPTLFPPCEIKAKLPTLRQPQDTPGSPMARRTKHEIRSAQQLASKHAQTPILWAKCLLGTCYSLWFTHLPSFALTIPNRVPLLELAFKILTHMQHRKLTRTDEVSYRVMMQLCGVYSQPVLAIRVLCEMREHGLTPNAITYGYYNRAIMEGKWGHHSKLEWKKLRNVVHGVSAFKSAGRERRARRNAFAEEEKMMNDGDNTSHLSLESTTSVDSHQMTTVKSATIGSDPGYYSISEIQEGSESPPAAPELPGPRTIPNPPQTMPQGAVSSIPPSDSCPLGGFHSSSSLNSFSSSSSASSCPPPPNVSRTTLTPSLPSTILPVQASLDFTQSDALRARLGAVVRSSAAGLASGADLTHVESCGAFKNSAGLLMTSPINVSTLDQSIPRRRLPNDLRQAVEPTLLKYDLITEPSNPHHPRRFSEQLLIADCRTAEPLSFGSDSRLLLRLTPVEIAPLLQAKQHRGGDIMPLPPPRGSVKVPPSPLTVSSKPDHLHSNFQSSREDRSSFFQRNTPERLSSIMRRGLEGAKSANANLQRGLGLWRRGAPRNPDGTNSTVRVEKSGVRRALLLKSATVDTLQGSDNSNDKESPGLPRRQSADDCVRVRINEERLEQPISVLEDPSKRIGSSHEITFEIQSDYGNSLHDNLPEGISSQTDVTSTDNNQPVVTVFDNCQAELIQSYPKLRAETHVVNQSSDIDDNKIEKEKIVTKSNIHSDYGDISDLSQLQSENSTCVVSASPTSTALSDISSLCTIPQISSLPSSPQRVAVIADDPLGALEPTFDPSPAKMVELGASTPQRKLSEVNGKNMSSTGFQEQELDNVSQDSFSNPSMWDSLKSIVAHDVRSNRPATDTEAFIQYFDEWVQSSPSIFKGKSGEITGSLISSFTSISSIVRKNLHEKIREVISTSNTPMKPTWYGSRFSELDSDDETVDGFYGNSADYLGVHPLDDIGTGSSFGGLHSRRESSIGGSSVPTQGADLFPSWGWDAQGPWCMVVTMTTGSKCRSCPALLFDEDIMAGWNADHSNLNTKCTFCEKMTVPLLTVTVTDLRHLPRPESSSDDVYAGNEKVNMKTCRDKMEPKGFSGQHVSSRSNFNFKEESYSSPLTVPYLSPLVLRKELETVLNHEGDSVLIEPLFIDNHPIIFWNLLWYFSRLRLPSHLPGLCLRASSLSPDRFSTHTSWGDVGWRNVEVKCLWDNNKYHAEVGSPLYVQWRDAKIPPSPLVDALVRERDRLPLKTLQSIQTSFTIDDLSPALRLLMQAHLNRPSGARRRHFPLYRDLLFLAVSTIPLKELNLTTFDREYRRAIEQEISAPKEDSPPSIAAVFCRRYFSPLSL